ncbi:MAG TPA: GIY-YIG nuclease family protein [Cyclobacteriaceae bacterium]|nr:GIY-YIG nuclease family protein [Cyclobacteriaceae bacterium]
MSTSFKVRSTYPSTKGSTDDLMRRLREHNSGKNFSTKRYAPWKLVWFTTKETKSKAVKPEMKLKNLSVVRTIEFMKKYPPPQTGSETYPWVQP